MVKIHENCPKCGHLKAIHYLNKDKFSKFFGRKGCQHVRGSDADCDCQEVF